MNVLDQLKQFAEKVRSQTLKEMNTAELIGSIFIGIIDYLKNLINGYTRQPGVDTYNVTTGGKTSLLNTYPTPEKGWTVLVRNDETNEGKATTRQWNGSIWVNLETVITEDDIMLSGGSAKTGQQLDDEKKTSNNPFVPTITGSTVMPIEQWRKFIIGLELSISYNSSLFYSPAIISVGASSITIQIYSSKSRWTGQDAVKVAEFILPISGVVGLTNEYGTIVIDSNYAPATSLTSQWGAYCGFSKDVFHPNNNEAIRIFKTQGQITDISKDISGKLPISDIEYNPFDKSIQGNSSMSIEQWRKFILGLELKISYNSSLFYSPAIISVGASSITIQIYSSKSRWTGQDAVKVAEFVIPKSNVQYIENEYGIIVIDSNYAPATSLTSQWGAYCGFSKDVFRVDNNETVRLYNKTKNITPAPTSSDLYDAFLPPYLYATVGLEFNLYYDTYILCPEYGNGHPPFLFDIDCAKGLIDRRSFRLTPTVSDIGEYDFTLKLLNKDGSIGRVLTSKLIIVSAECPSVLKNVLAVGDSTMDDTGETIKQLQLNISECSGATPVFLGTHHPAPYKNEARSGLTYASYSNTRLAYRFEVEDVDPNIDLSDIYKFRGYYYNNANNPVILTHRWKINPDGTGFVIGYYFTDTFQPPTTFPAYLTPTNPSNPIIKVTGYSRKNFSIFRNNEGTGGRDIAYYRTEVLGLNASDKIDVVIMNCGINDCSGTLMNESAINGLITNVSDLITAFKADNPNTKFVLCLPKSRNSDLRLTSRNMLRYNIFNFSKKAVETFANYEGVIISQSGFAMDRFYGYPLIEQKVANRYEETLLMANNDVHPRTEGYYQEADGMTGSVLVALNL